MLFDAIFYVLFEVRPQRLDIVLIFIKNNMIAKLTHTRTKWIAVLHPYKCKIRANMNRIFKNPANIEAYMEFRKNPPVFSQT